MYDNINTVKLTGKRNSKSGKKRFFYPSWIKATFVYKKRFHSSAFMRDKHSMLIGQLIKETIIVSFISCPINIECLSRIKADE